MSKRRAVAWALLALIVAGLMLPQNLSMPVAGARSSDWHPETFWFEPWGASGVHKGIDIFAEQGRAVIAPTPGIVVTARTLPRGGQIVLVLTSKWRLHYFAHLSRTDASAGEWLSTGDLIGAVGDSGNAVGKAPHLHYSIVSLVPLPWLIDGSAQGWKKAFYLDPTVLLPATSQ